MADDPPAEEELPAAVRDWLADVTDGRELTEAELLAALDGDDADGDRPVGSSRLDALQADVRALEDELDRKLADVRDRVIQVKREADGKAPTDHDHEVIERELESMAATVETLHGDVETVRTTLEELDDRVDRVDGQLEAGFENFESVLEYLFETTDDQTGKLSTLARALRDLRGRFDRVATASARRAAAEQLRTDANAAGVSTAECMACEGRVELGLLSAPECPHCAARFTELEPRRGFFRSSRLHTGERPALEGATASDLPDLEAIVTDAESAPDDVPSVRVPDPAGEAAEAAPDDDPREVPIEELEGVGSTYAERLREAGVESVTDLALADPERVADQAGIAPGRIETIVARARERAGLE